MQMHLMPENVAPRRLGNHTGSRVGYRLFAGRDMSYARLIGGDRNRLVQSCGSLMGIAAGLLADQQLNDAEIRFLANWLDHHEDISTVWPGDVLCRRVKEVLADGVITGEERAHLVATLQEICGGGSEVSQQRSPVNQLAFDSPRQITFSGFNFCVTGEFVFGPRERVVETITDRGGHVQESITKKLNYLLVGVRGGDEWKRGSYGTKIEKAIEYKRDGVPLYIVREDTWSAALKAA